MQQGFCLRFLIGVIGVFVLIGYSSIDTLLQLCRDIRIQPNEFHIIFLLEALTSDTVSPFVAIVSALPFSSNYVDEVKSKFALFSMLRTNYSTYLLSRIIACFLLGGAVILAGVLVTYFISTLAFLPMEEAADNEESQLSEFIKQCVLLFLNGGLWAVVGMTMSTVMESKYISYASPFIVYYLLVILYERYFPDAWLLCPKNWMNPDIWPYGVGSAALFLLELTFLCGLVFYIRGKRRLEQL